jgi:hypothetical protein
MKSHSWYEEIESAADKDCLRHMGSAYTSSSNSKPFPLVFKCKSFPQKDERNISHTKQNKKKVQQEMKVYGRLKPISVIKKQCISTEESPSQTCLL